MRHRDDKPTQFESEMVELGTKLILAKSLHLRKEKGEEE